MCWLVLLIKATQISGRWGAAILDISGLDTEERGVSVCVCVCVCVAGWGGGGSCVDTYRLQQEALMNHGHI